jgi:GH18 family chitinase
MMVSFVLALMVNSLVSHASVDQAGAADTTAPRVVGYYADWTAERYPLADIPADKLTHVNYAFGKIGTDNRLTVNASVAVVSIRAIAANPVAHTDCFIRSRS